MKCVLCGAHFDATTSCTKGCPMSSVTGGCGLVRCPNCGHEFPDPDKSTLARLVKRWLERRQDPKPDPEVTNG